MAAPQVIEITAGEIAEELKRRGISSDERVTLTIEPEREIDPGPPGIPRTRRRGGSVGC